MTLKELFDELDAVGGPIPLARLRGLVRRVRLTRRDVASRARFGPHCYRRNLIRSMPGYQALVLCWRSGQRSPVHDHNGSACAVRVIEGVATEVLFDRSAAGLIYPSRTNEHRTGSVCASFDSDMHQMGNLQPPGEDLITLHIYSPPLVAMRTYFLGDSVTGEDGRVRVAAIRARAVSWRSAVPSRASAGSSRASSGRRRAPALTR